MKRFLLPGILFLSLLILAPEPVQAQFWKKWGKKKEAKRKPVKKPVKAPPVVKKPVAPAKKSQASQLDYPKTELKKRYRVDVLVALYLDDLVKNDKPTYKDRVPEKAATGLNFYEGIKLAADTLTHFGYRIDVYVHDITNTLTAAETLVNTNSLDSSDLIIGALNAPQVTAIARYAKQKKINFVSALSPSDGNVKDNYYFTMLQPTLQTHCEWIRNDINKRNSKKPFVIYHRSKSSADENAWKLMAAVGDGKDNGKEVKCNTLPPVEQLYLLFDSTKTNVVVMPILDANYADSLIQQLVKNFPGYRFDVYGMPSWKGMSSLRKVDLMPNVTVILTAPYYFDGTTPAGQAVANSYSRTFGGRPGEMVFRGYETLYWYAYLLDKYGTIFNPKLSDSSPASFTKFDVRPKWTKDGDLLYNENQHLYLYRYQNGSYSVE